MVYLDGLMRRKVKLWLALLLLAVLTLIAAWAISAQAKIVEQQRLAAQMKLLESQRDFLISLTAVQIAAQPNAGNPTTEQIETFLSAFRTTPLRTVATEIGADAFAKTAAPFPTTITADPPSLPVITQNPTPPETTTLTAATVPLPIDTAQMQAAFSTTPLNNFTDLQALEQVLRGGDELDVANFVHEIGQIGGTVDTFSQSFTTVQDVVNKVQGLQNPQFLDDVVHNFGQLDGDIAGLLSGSTNLAGMLDSVADIPLNSAASILQSVDGMNGTVSSLLGGSIANMNQFLTGLASVENIPGFASVVQGVELLDGGLSELLSFAGGAGTFSELFSTINSLPTIDLNAVGHLLGNVDALGGTMSVLMTGASSFEGLLTSMSQVTSLEGVASLVGNFGLLDGSVTELLGGFGNFTTMLSDLGNIANLDSITGVMGNLGLLGGSYTDLLGGGFGNFEQLLGGLQNFSDLSSLSSIIGSFDVLQGDLPSLFSGFGNFDQFLGGLSGLPLDSISGTFSSFGLLGGNANLLMGGLTFNATLSQLGSFAQIGQLGGFLSGMGGLGTTMPALLSSFGGNFTSMLGTLGGYNLSSISSLLPSLAGQGVTFQLLSAAGLPNVFSLLSAGNLGAVLQLTSLPKAIPSIGGGGALSALTGVVSGGGQCTGPVDFGGQITYYQKACTMVFGVCPNCPSCTKALRMACGGYEELDFIPYGGTPGVNFICAPKGWLYIGGLPAAGKFILGKGLNTCLPTYIGISGGL